MAAHSLNFMRFAARTAAILCVCATGAFGADKPPAVEVSLGDVSLNKVAFLVAADAGIYAKNGLSVHQYITPYAANKARHQGVNVPAQYVKDDAADDADISVGGGTPMIVNFTRSARATDRVIIATFESQVRDHIIASEAIKSPADLKGKRLGFTDDGAVTHFAAISFAKAMGWDPNQDISLIGNANAPEAIKDGKVDAFIGSALVQAKASQEKLKDLVDLGQYNIPVAGSSLNADRAWLKKNPETAKRFVKSTVEAIALIKTNRQAFFDAMAKWYNIKDRATQQSMYAQVAGLPKKPYPAVDGIKKTMEVYNYREMKKHKPEDFYDASFMTELDKSGYIDGLYR